MNTLVSKLKSFAKGRETAYKVHKRLTVEKSTAISRILTKCEHFSRAKSNKWVAGIKQDLLLILPKEDSPLKNKRADILNILNEY